MNQCKPISTTGIKGRICKYILASILYIPQQELTSVSIPLTLPCDILKLKDLSQEVLSQHYIHKYHIGNGEA